MTISVEILIAIFFVLLTPIVISLMWVKGIDYMQKNYPDYKGYDLFDEPFDNPMIKEPSVSPQNASEMMITTNEDIINSIPTDDDFSDWDVTLMDGLEDESYVSDDFQIGPDGAYEHTNDMTPREKASELIVKCQTTIKSLDYNEAKQCALICCNEVLGYMGADRGYTFWLEVKQEVEKL